jgi:hypothetical protein
VRACESPPSPNRPGCSRAITRSNAPTAEHCTRPARGLRSVGACNSPPSGRAGDSQSQKAESCSAPRPLRSKPGVRYIARGADRGPAGRPRQGEPHGRARREAAPPPSEGRGRFDSVPGRSYQPPSQLVVSALGSGSARTGLGRSVSMGNHRLLAPSASVRRLELVAIWPECPVVAIARTFRWPLRLARRRMPPGSLTLRLVEAPGAML